MSRTSGFHGPGLGRCFVCGGRFLFGPDRFEGRSLPEWRLMACDDCFSSHPDGLDPDDLPAVVGYLNACRIEFDLDAVGRIVWPESAAAKPVPRPRRTVDRAGLRA